MPKKDWRVWGAVGAILMIVVRFGKSGPHGGPVLESIEAALGGFTMGALAAWVANGFPRPKR